VDDGANALLMAAMGVVIDCSREGLVFREAGAHGLGPMALGYGESRLA
jgi:hypothetical protein